MTRANVGICDMAVYLPQLQLRIEDLANERDLEYAKLNKGLGLHTMVIPDVHEDAATMAANAVHELITRNQLDPGTIGRIYLGTESALDGAKPTATYTLEMLRRKFRGQYGVDCFKHCDVVDLTFACVGGVDALHNTLDWVRGGSERVGIVVTSDFAKYELESGGEYTQGAGAVAMLVKHNPKLLVIDDVFGVGTQGVHDFFKPKRSATKEDLVTEVLRLAKVDNITASEILRQLPNSLRVDGILDSNEEVITIYKDTPIFDGQYSNWTYQNRIREAYIDYCNKHSEKEGKPVRQDHIESWERLIFHLPYAYHGKRIASELYMISKKSAGQWDSLAADLPAEPKRNNYDSQESFEKDRSAFLRAITKTDQYRSFVNEKLEKAQRASSRVGNMYACSIFLALMSTLVADAEQESDLAGKHIGLIGYGSGSKSKVFRATLQEGWRSVTASWRLSAKLDQGTVIDYPTYERLHRGQQLKSVVRPQGEFVLDHIASDGVRLGARYYAWRD